MYSGYFGSEHRSTHSLHKRPVRISVTWSPITRLTGECQSSYTTWRHQRTARKSSQSSLDAICRQTSNIKHIDRRLTIPCGPHGTKYNWCRKHVESARCLPLERILRKKGLRVLYGLRLGLLICIPKSPTEQTHDLCVDGYLTDFLNISLNFEDGEDELLLR